jgi:hypothetical protein
MNERKKPDNQNLIQPSEQPAALGAVRKIKKYLQPVPPVRMPAF